MEIHHSLTFGFFIVMMIVIIVNIVNIVMIVIIVIIVIIVMIVMEIHCSLTFCIRFFLLLRNIRPTCNTSQNDLILIRILTNKQTKNKMILFAFLFKTIGLLSLLIFAKKSKPIQTNDCKTNSLM